MVEGLLKHTCNVHCKFSRDILLPCFSFPLCFKGVFGSHKAVSGLNADG